MSKRVVFIGNRASVLQEIANSNYFELVSVLVVRNSPLHNYLERNSLELPYTPFSFSDKGSIIDLLKNLEFDYLISNGCPFLLPVSRLKKAHQEYLNIHPTYLPYLKGKTPINGVFFNEMNFFGATIHVMSDEIDEGSIVHQEKAEVTPDMDLGLLYFASFEMERRVIKHVIAFHKQHGVLPDPKPQDHPGSSFNRNPHDQTIDIKMTTQEMIKRIRAFGIRGQGCLLELDQLKFVLYDAEVIHNQFILDCFKDSPAGTIVLRYDTKVLLRTVDGIIKLNRYDESAR